ncbi:calmegin-like isoform X2 [Neopsephotus bourkii]|uniref:calmegin-like isoform X2 n=1 Tax=Neopsephotus bourkii TaxID=309878 RepID=UPI002AA5C0E9|nr:calmegin-like isoform X2 [Neopsephotus bourkii]
MFSQPVTAAEDHPWLWVLYILTFALPVGLGVLFCWPTKKPDEDIDFKKPDISKPITKGELDQEGEELDDDEIQLEEEKGNEDTAEDDEGGGEKNDIADTSQEEGDKSNKSSSEDEVKEANEDTGYGDSPLKSVRKRRVRKD